MRIGIIGVGVVGNALHYYLETCGHSIYLRDLKKGHRADLSKTEIVFIAVPTPVGDLSHVIDALSHIPTGCIAVLKSTVPPGTTDRLQAMCPDLRLLFNPEFLSEASADWDMMHPSRQIVGYTEASKADASRILELLPKAPYERIVPASSAEMIKSTTNSFYALKVAFANQIFELCEAMQIPYDEVRASLEADPWAGAQHWTTPHRGYRGYGGKCLPKDTRALLELAAEKRVDLSILKIAEIYNNALHRSQGRKHP